MVAKGSKQTSRSSRLDLGLGPLGAPPRGSPEPPKTKARFVSHSLLRTGMASPPRDRLPYVKPRAEITNFSGTNDVVLRGIAEELRESGGEGHDTATWFALTGRIRSRIRLHRLDTLREYRTYVAEHPDELDEFDALLTDVRTRRSGILRDVDAWRALERTWVRPFLSSHQPGSAARIWVPGCAGGDDAYSVAVLFKETADEMKRDCKLQIFATDVDEQALEVARAGRYPQSALSQLSASRRKRFFEVSGRSGRVRKFVRDSVVFATHDAASDPPFSRIDLILCRSLLSESDEATRRRLVPVFHRALREHGVAFLGPGSLRESDAGSFTVVSDEWGICRRLRAPHVESSYEWMGRFWRASDTTLEMRRPGGSGESALTGVVERALLERYAPASVVIDAANRIAYYHGPTEDYLTQPAGTPTNDVLVMARAGLRPILRNAVVECRERGHEVAATARLRHGENGTHVRMNVSPVADSHGGSTLILVTFQRASGEEGLAEPPDAVNEEFAQRMESELELTHAELKTTLEEHGAVVEDLKAANEEVSSVNEELQAANEELQTSKEELQSLNEELTTVNRQLEEHLGELETVSRHLESLLETSHIASLVLDTALRIQKFTPATESLLPLRASDIGRPITDLAGPCLGESLVQDVERALLSLRPSEREMRIGDGKRFVRHILPCRGRDNRVEGVAVQFVDVTDLTQAQERLTANEGRLRQCLAELDNIYRSAPVGLAVLDRSQRVIRVNEALAKLEGSPAERHVGKTLSDLFPALSNRLCPIVQEVIDTGCDRMREEFDSPLKKDGGPLRHWHTSWLSVRDESGRVFCVTGVIHESLRARLHRRRRGVEPA